MVQSFEEILRTSSGRGRGAWQPEETRVSSEAQMVPHEKSKRSVPVDLSKE